MTTEGIVHLEAGWNDVIKLKALQPLEKMVEEEFKG